MSVLFRIDGRDRWLHGDHDSIIEQTRELRAYGHEVEQAKQPRRERTSGVRGISTASAWIKR